MDDFDDPLIPDCCCRCGTLLTVFDTIVRIARSKRPTRPERIYCKPDWDAVRTRFTRRFDRKYTRQMVRIHFAQYGPPAANVGEFTVATLTTN